MTRPESGCDPAERSDDDDEVDMTNGPFDPGRHRWREVKGEPGLPYLVHHDYTILGYERGAGTLDMLVRWGTDGGHCPIHRHTATTTVLVLEGEQHLWDLYPDGTRGEHRIRRAGDYALSPGDEHPHLERGGDSGGIVFFSNHSDDGRLYQVLDPHLNVVFDVTMDVLLEDFESNT